MSSNVNRYLKIVEKLADNFCQEAIWYENKCNWTGVFHNTQIANAKTVLRALPTNFYNGSVGVAYFLAAAFHQFQKPIYKQTSIGAFEKSYSQIHKIRSERIGFYEGQTGIAFSMTQAGEWLHENDLIEKGKKIIENIITNDILSWSLDMQEGCTGALPTLILLNKKYNFSNIELFTESIGNYILNAANKTKKGWSWKTVDGNFPDVTGYAHGTAGIAHAMIELYDFTKNNNYLEAAEQAIKYENQFFNEKYLNWKDVRTTNQKRSNRRHFALSAWCVGGVGIGYSRLRTFQLTGNENYLKDAKSALKNSSEKLFDKANNFSLCHGFFGDMSFLLWASQKLHDVSYEDLLLEKVNSLLDEYQDFEKPLPDGSNFVLENPSFMLGWAGIGYFFLRLCNRNTFPEILLIS